MNLLQVGRGSEVGIGLTTGREAMLEAAANAGITDRRPRRCGLSRFLNALCGSHRFKNLQVRLDQVPEKNKISVVSI